MESRSFFFVAQLISFPKSGNSIIPLDLYCITPRRWTHHEPEISENDGKIRKILFFQRLNMLYGLLIGKLLHEVSHVRFRVPSLKLTVSSPLKMVGFHSESPFPRPPFFRWLFDVSVFFWSLLNALENEHAPLGIFYFHPYLGKMIPNLTSIFFKGVGSTTNQFTSKSPNMWVS